MHLKPGFHVILHNRYELTMAAIILVARRITPTNAAIM